jgi:hypothetical protein
LSSSQRLDPLAASRADIDRHPNFILAAFMASGT